MADIKLFDIEEKKPNVVERAALKEAINKERPGTMEYEGLEKIYDPKVRSKALLVGDTVGGVLLGELASKGVINHKANKVNNYLAEGGSPETKAMADKIIKSNKELMSQKPTTGRQTQLISNTVTESRLPKDNISDLERAVKEGKLREPQKFDADLEGVYATEAANAVKEKGIRLFDVEAQKPKFVKGLEAFSNIVNGIVTGQGLRTASDLAMDRVSKKAKRNALMALYKDDKATLNAIKYGIYPDKVIDQMFKDNVDKIIEYQNKS